MGNESACPLTRCVGSFIDVGQQGANRVNDLPRNPAQLGRLVMRGKADCPRLHVAPEEPVAAGPIDQSNRAVDPGDQPASNVAQIFPHETAIVRLVGALLLEPNDEWAVCRRYTGLETSTRLSDGADVWPTAIPAA